MFQTDYEFTLPIGYLDKNGVVYRNGSMRLTTAKDELEAKNDPKARRNPAYLSVALLARVITRLGTLPEITEETIENLFQTDFNFLQELYARINQDAALTVDFTCPHCTTAMQEPFNRVFEKVKPSEPEARKAEAVVTEG